MTTFSSYQDNTQQQAAFENKVEDSCSVFVGKFLSCTRQHALLHFFFSIALVSEVFIFLGFFSFFSASSLLAFSVGIFFLTIFSYFVLRFYFQAKKPEQFLSLRDEFIASCENSLSYQKGHPNYYLSISHAALRLAAYFQNREFTYYPILENWTTLRFLLQKLSGVLHWEDVQKFKEYLLYTSVEMHVALIKSEPTDVEIHASLASTYETLARIYKPVLEAPWISPKYYSKEMSEKSERVLKQAIEELKIISDYTPADPWSHAKLASLYHLLDWKQQEIQEYETILSLCPQDQETLYRLGVLYFEQGLTSRGLKIYDKLKKNKFAKADDLLSFYDSCLTTTSNLF